jgi:DNA replication protein DnaC
MALLNAPKKEAASIDTEFVFDLHPYEGTYLFEKFVKEEKELTMKWVQKEKQTMFGNIIFEDPEEIELSLSPTTATTIKDIKCEFSTGARMFENRISFALLGKVDSRQSKLIKALAVEFREYIKTRSIYRAKAIQLQDMRTGNIHVPKFIDTTNIQEDEFILNDNINKTVTSSIFTVIKNYAACKAAQIPIKRGVLLSGPYGTGKTLVARQTAKRCVDAGWTFILLKDSEDLASAFAFSQRFSPAVIFVEDIDTAFKSNYRTSATNDFLNTFDNIYSKESETMFIMTSNHPEQLSKPMLRPGRVDCVIQFELPNAQSVEKLINHYGKQYVKGFANDIKEVSERLATANISPAVLREIIERAKLSAIELTGQAEFNVLELIGTYEDMQHHIDLIDKAIDLGVKKVDLTLDEKITEVYDIIKRYNG